MNKPEPNSENEDEKIIHLDPDAEAKRLAEIKLKQEKHIKFVNELLAKGSEIARLNYESRLTSKFTSEQPGKRSFVGVCRLNRCRVKTAIRKICKPVAKFISNQRILPIVFFKDVARTQPLMRHFQGKPRDQRPPSWWLVSQKKFFSYTVLAWKHWPCGQSSTIQQSTENKISPTVAEAEEKVMKKENMKLTDHGTSLEITGVTSETKKFLLVLKSVSKLNAWEKVAQPVVVDVSQQSTSHTIADWQKQFEMKSTLKGAEYRLEVFAVDAADQTVLIGQSTLTSEALAKALGVNETDAQTGATGQKQSPNDEKGPINWKQPFQRVLKLGCWALGIGLLASVILGIVWGTLKFKDSRAAKAAGLPPATSNSGGSVSNGEKVPIDNSNNPNHIVDGQKPSPCDVDKPGVAIIAPSVATTEAKQTNQLPTVQEFKTPATPAQAVPAINITDIGDNNIIIIGKNNDGNGAGSFAPQASGYASKTPTQSDVSQSPKAGGVRSVYITPCESMRLGRSEDIVKVVEAGGSVEFVYPSGFDVDVFVERLDEATRRYVSVPSSSYTTEFDGSVTRSFKNLSGMDLVVGFRCTKVSVSKPFDFSKRRR